MHRQLVQSIEEGGHYAGMSKMTDNHSPSLVETSDECDLLIKDQDGKIRIKYDPEFYTKEPKNLWRKLFSLDQHSNSNHHHHYQQQQQHPHHQFATQSNSVKSHKSKAKFKGYDEYYATIWSKVPIIDSMRHSNPNQYDKIEQTHQQIRLKWLRIVITLLILIVVLALVVSVLRIDIQPEDGDFARNYLTSEVHSSYLDYHTNSRWLISRSKCHIPNIDPWHESIKSYVKVSEDMNCSQVLFDENRSVALTFSRGNSLYFTKQGLNSNTSCCFRPIERPLGDDKTVEISNKCVPFRHDGMQIHYELIKIECQPQNYSNVHMFIEHKTEEEKAAAWVAYEKLKLNDFYNVVMIGVDTVSRLNGIRQLNKTQTLMRNKFNVLEFPGYNKVGENTFPNLIPLLTGLTPEELITTSCWSPSSYSQASETGDDYLDNCKYLWNFYQELGYITYLSEDWPSASTFNYLKEGFKNEPTTHYGRPFTLARDRYLSPSSNKLTCKYCLYDRPLVEVDLANLRSFIKEYNDKPFFAFHWINCPQHDDLNGASSFDSILANFMATIHPMTREKTFVILFSDHGYRWDDFVSTRVGHYEASLPMMTIAIPQKFLRQHPDLVDNIKQHQSVLLTPFDMFHSLIDLRNLGLKRTINNKSQHLKNQSTVHSDNIGVTSRSVPKIHVTQLPDDPDEFSVTAATAVSQENKLDGTNYQLHNFTPLSIFRRHEPTELDRSCIEAGIPDNYCVCHQFQQVPITTPDVIGAAYYFVYVHLYQTLKDSFAICHQLELKQIKSAQMYDFQAMKNATSIETTTTNMTTNTTEPTKLQTTTTSSSEAHDQQEQDVDESHFLPNREYNMALITKPGDALFQEVIRYYGSNDTEACNKRVANIKKRLDDPSVSYSVKRLAVLEMNHVCKFSVHSDSISRLNLYKDQSKCVKNNIELKKVCYCKESNE